MTNCIFFGDSITYGEYDGIQGGWVDYLKRYSHRKFYNENANEVSIFNLGIGGETTNGLIKRFEVELNARKSENNNLVFFSYGANDLSIVDGKTLVTIDKYKENYLKVIKKTKEITSNIYIISIMPISKNIDGKISTTGKIRTNKVINEYNKVLIDIANSENVNFIDVNTDFEKNKEDYLSKDLVHPNDKGYVFIANKIKPIISKYF